VFAFRIATVKGVIANVPEHAATAAFSLTSENLKNTRISKSVKMFPNGSGGARQGL